MMRRTLLLALLLLSLVGAVLPVAAQDANFQGLGCYADPTGDAGHPSADLVEVCVNYDRRVENFVVVVETDGGNDPTGDPAWADPSTALLVGFDVDGDEVVDRTLRYTVEGGAVEVVVGNSGDGGDPCPGTGDAANGLLLARVPRACLDEAPAIGIGVTLTYRPDGGSVAMDQLPDDGLTAPLPDDPPESPVCANATSEAGPAVTIRRVRCDIGGTEPISQAVATSQFVFDDPATDVIDPYQAEWVVLARDDDFADALAGATLSFGQGPLLFTYSPASAARLGQDPDRLAAITRAEIIRSLPRGRTVYIMGGTAAISPGVEQQLGDLGYEVVRFAGTGREQTARLISREVDRIVADFAATTSFVDTNMVLIANRANWPDAVMSGSLGAFWGMPVLLVDAQGAPHPETLAALDELRPDYIHIIGGRGVVSVDTFLGIFDHAAANGYGRGRPGEDVTTPGTPWVSFCAYSPREGVPSGPQFTCRWGGDDRIVTGALVGQFNRDMIQRFQGMPFIPPNPQEYAVAVNLDGAVTAPNFAYVLSAATVSGRFGGAVFIPTRDQTVEASVVDRFCATPGADAFFTDVDQVVFIGDTDLLTGAFEDAVRDFIQAGCD